MPSTLVSGHQDRSGTPDDTDAVVYGGRDLVADLCQWTNFMSLPNIAYLGVAALIYSCPTMSGFPSNSIASVSAPYATPGVEPGSVHGVTLEIGVHVLLRNLVLCFGVYSGWHYAMYSASAPLSTQKYNPRFPPDWEHTSARRWTLAGSVICSVYELVALHVWATRGGCVGSLGDAPLYTIITWFAACFIRSVWWWMASSVLRFHSTLFFRPCILLGLW